MGVRWRTQALLIYFVLLYIRPQDFVPLVQGQPLELVFAGGTIVIAALGYSRKRHGPLPAHVWLLPAWVTIIFCRMPSTETSPMA